MNRKFLILVVGIGVLGLSFSACHKSSNSSSSGGGTVSGAVANLASLAFTGSNITPASVGVKGARAIGHLKPAWLNCMGTTSNTTVTQGLPSGNCPASGDTGWNVNGTVYMTMTNCGASGYTYNGKIELSVVDEGMCFTNTNVLDALSGSATLTSSGTISITGNGVNQPTCTINIPLNFSYSGGATANGSGTACSQPVTINFQ